MKHERITDFMSKFSMHRGRPRISQRGGANLLFNQISRKLHEDEQLQKKIGGGVQIVNIDPLSDQIDCSLPTNIFKFNPKKNRTIEIPRQFYINTKNNSWGHHKREPLGMNVNDTCKSPKFACYELLWQSRGNGKKKNHYLQEQDLSLSIELNF